MNAHTPFFITRRAHPVEYKCHDCGSYYTTLTVQPEYACRCPACIQTRAEKEVRAEDRRREKLRALKKTQGDGDE